MAVTKSLGALEVTFRGNADQLVAEGKKATNIVKGVSDTATSSSAAFVKSFGLMAVATTGVAVAVKGLNAVLEVAEIKDLARNANLSTKAFQELAYMTDKAGISQDAAAKASRVFAMSMSELKADTGQLNEFLGDHLSRLQADLKASKSQEQAYRLVADAMQRLKSEGDRTTLATKLFGEAGADLVDVLKDGSKGLDENAAKAKALNIIMSDESIQAADELSEKYRELTSNLDRWWKKAQLSVAGYVSSVVTALNAPGTKNPGGGKFGPGFNRSPWQEGTQTQFEPTETGWGAATDDGKDHLDKVDDKSTHEMWTAQEELQALIQRTEEAQDRLKQQSEGLKDALRSPYEQLAIELEKIDELQKKNKISADEAGQAHVMAAAAAASGYLSAGAAISGALTQLFENNKTAAIANAIVNTAQAITSALAAPWPLSLGYAAAAAAQGYAQIATIKSTTRGGGGGGAAPAVSNGGGSAAAAPAGGGQQGSSSTLYVRGIGKGDWFDDETIKMVAKKLVAAQRDGTQVVLPR